MKLSPGTKLVAVSMLRNGFIAGALAVSAGCVNETAGQPQPDRAGAASPVAEPTAAANETPTPVQEGSREARGVLKLVNVAQRDALIAALGAAGDPQLAAQIADDIIAYRTGDDGVMGTADDQSFADVAELDRLPRLGAAQMQALLIHAQAQGFVERAETLGFTEVYERVIAVRCAPCHVSGAAGQLEMPDAERAYANLVHAQGREACAGRTLVAPGAPQASALYQKVSGEELCGAHMPLGRSPLNPEEIALIRRWIEEGAAR
jgi:hypothetical protein